MAQFKNTRELIEAWPGLDNAVRAALLSAISTRGRWKGFLLASPPSMRSNPTKALAWQAIIGQLAPVRASVWAQMMFTQEQRKEFEALELAVAGTLGLAIRAQEPDFRWSLFAHHSDTDKLRTAFHKFCQDPGRVKA
jgi:hypothetical protein